MIPVLRSTVWILVLVVAPVPASAALQSADSLALIDLERVWNEAHLRGDVDALDRLWADELIVTVPAMRPMTKSEVIAFARSGRMVFQRYETTDLAVRVDGDAAVVTGRLIRSRALAGETVVDDWLFTKFYLRRAGHWRVAALHASARAP